MARGGEGPRRKQATVYDAVAGRIGYEGFIGEEAPSSTRDTVSYSNIAVPPEEALFRRKGAPLRFEEDDIYAADRHLEPHQRLPDSDLLKSIHTYVSDFYSRATPDGGKHDVRSMDETALLAMGILLEEAATGALGKTGDLALLEGHLDDVELLEKGQNDLRSDGRLQRSVIDRTQPVRRAARGRSAKALQRSEDSKSSRSRSRPL